jgi:hypothetical protein
MFKKIILIAMAISLFGCIQFTQEVKDHFSKLDTEMKQAKDECLQGKRMDCWGDPAGGGADAGGGGE